MNRTVAFVVIRHSATVVLALAYEYVYLTARIRLYNCTDPCLTAYVVLELHINKSIAI